MIGRGQLGLHRIESLFMVKSRGRAKGFEWAKTDRSSDTDLIKAWLGILKEIFSRLSEKLKDLGLDPEDLEEVENWLERNVRPSPAVIEILASPAVSLSVSTLKPGKRSSLETGPAPLVSWSRSRRALRAKGSRFDLEVPRARVSIVR